MKIKLFRHGIAITLFIIPVFAIAQTIHGNNVWITQSGYAHIHSSPEWFYQLDIHLRLNTFDPVFRQNLDTIRIGKQIDKDIDFSLAFEYLPTQLPSMFVNEQRFWHQIDYQHALPNNFSMHLYNRLEHRWLHEVSGISLRDRFKFVLKSCALALNICPFLASETFININRVSWDPSQTLSQQRSFVGIETRLSKAVQIRAAYLNQFLWMQGNANFSFDIVNVEAAFNFD